MNVIKFSDQIKPIGTNNNKKRYTFWIKTNSGNSKTFYQNCRKACEMHSKSKVENEWIARMCCDATVTDSVKSKLLTETFKKKKKIAFTMVYRFHFRSMYRVLSIAEHWRGTVEKKWTWVSLWMGYELGSSNNKIIMGYGFEAKKERNTIICWWWYFIFSCRFTDL